MSSPLAEMRENLPGQRRHSGLLVSVSRQTDRTDVRSDNMVSLGSVQNPFAFSEFAWLIWLQVVVFWYFANTGEMGPPRQV